MASLIHFNLETQSGAAGRIRFARCPLFPDLRELIHRCASPGALPSWMTALFPAAKVRNSIRARSMCSEKTKRTRPTAAWTAHGQGIPIKRDPVAHFNANQLGNRLARQTEL